MTAAVTFICIFVPSCTKSTYVNVPTHPVAEYPTEINLGKRERGEIATASFTVANRGGADLILDQFQSNCSCSGIEQKQGNEYRRLERLRIKPREEVELHMRVSVRGVPIGAMAKNGVRFRTNDPNKPTGQIDAVISQVTGGVYAIPEKVVIGTMQVGDQVKSIFDVRDDAVTPRVLERVTSTQARVKVRILDKSEIGEPAKSLHDGVLIARVEVQVDRSTPGNIESDIHLHLAGAERMPDHVQILGRVASAIEISPSTLVLPRASPEGPIHSANCLIRSTQGKPFDLSLESCPDHLTVTIPKGENASSRFATVTLRPKSLALEASARDQPIRFRCKMGDRLSVVELRVLVMP